MSRHVAPRISSGFREDKRIGLRSMRCNCFAKNERKKDVVRNKGSLAFSHKQLKEYTCAATYTERHQLETPAAHGIVPRRTEPFRISCRHANSQHIN